MRKGNVFADPRGVRILALASIFGLVACGDPSGGGQGGSGGRGGNLGTGGAGKGGNGTGGAAGQGGATGTGGAAGVTGTGGDAGAGGTAGVSGTGGGAGGIAGAAGTGGAAGAGGGVGGAAGSGATDAGMDAPADGGNGGPCTAASDCASGFCVDRVCCETACGGLCMACSNAKTGAADGLCRGIAAATDPDDECAQQAVTTCGTDGTCNGAGACRKYMAGVSCSSESCAGSTHTPGGMCNGSGTCQVPNSTSCGNYVCGGTSCKTTCLSNADCSTASGTFCNAAGHCVTPQANGAACSAAIQCMSNFCVDGLCCESACTGLCMACSNTKTGAGDGRCRAVAAATDPDNECAVDAQTSCAKNGLCDGAGACQRYAAGTTCGPETCSGSTDTSARTCDGAGTCRAGSNTSCGAYMCGAGTCLKACTSNIDCTAGNFCSGGHCVAVQANGIACTGNGDCQSGFCVDGVCCENACGGTCMTCNGVGTVGRCTPAVSGTDGRNNCSASAPTSCGLDGTCDGAGACRYWGAGTQCGVASCTAATLLPIPTCNGSGTCAAGTPTSCGVYQCSTTAASCKTGCTSDTDCNNGFCSAGACIANNSVTPVNLAGNGNLEYGLTSGWSNTGGTLALKTGAGLVHGGTYSIADTGRTANYMGPSYALPTGAGKYIITAWAMQNTDPTFASGVLQYQLNCGAANTANYLPVGNYGVSFPQGGWTKITGTIDLAATPGCDPSMTGGVVDSVNAYLNQTGTEAPSATPDLFMDDLVVNVTDGHNLVGNPNFEAGTTAGWSQTGGTMAVSTARAHGGTNSLVVAGRTQIYEGQQWNFPIGTAKYNVVFYALHTGSLPHTLMLQPVYTCGAALTQYPAPVATASNVAGGTWNLLSGSVTFPPADAPAGCQLTAAGVYVQQESGTCGTGTGQVECPDIYVDDVSITLAP